MILRHLRWGLSVKSPGQRAGYQQMYGLIASRLSIKWVIIDHQVALNRNAQRFNLNALYPRRKALQASFGTLFTIMPQEPQIAMRQDQR